MANVLIVSGSYFPNATANAVCMKQYEEALLREGHKVFYAIKRYDFDMEDVTKEGVVEVYHVGNSVEEFYRVCGRLQKICLPQPLKLLFNSLLYSVKVFMKIYTMMLYGGQRKYSQDKYLDIYAKTINKIVEKESIDVIISVSMPFLSNLAVLRYKSKYEKEDKTKWISYMIDSYSQKYGIKGKEQSDKTNEEIEVFLKADSVLMLDVLKNDYYKEPFVEYFDKVQVAYLPLFNLRDDSIEKTLNLGIVKEAGSIDCVFAGTLYDDTSSLKYFCEFVKQLDDNKFIFHFMGKIYPENLKLLKNLESETKCRIKIYGRMPYEYAAASMMNADILINIGNLSTNQIPSKIFQYMAELKPILNFYKILEDTALPYLEKYPLAYNIFEENKVDIEVIDGFINFYNNLDNVSINREQLREIYKGYTSEDVCTEFIQYFNKVISD